MIPQSADIQGREHSDESAARIHNNDNSAEVNKKTDANAAINYTRKSYLLYR